MASRIVMDGNAFYEIDEECLRNQKTCRGQESRDGWKGSPDYKEKGGTRWNPRNSAKS